MRRHSGAEDSGHPSGKEERRFVGKGRTPRAHFERRQWRLFSADGAGWAGLAASAWKPSAALRAAVADGASWDILGPLIINFVLDGSGPFSLMLRRGMCRRAAKGVPGIAESDVWPMPLIPLRLPSSGRARLRAKRRLAAVHVSNLVLTMLSLLRSGGSSCKPFLGTISAPQKRCQTVVMDAVSRFLRGLSGASGEVPIRSLLREDHFYSGGGPTPTLPLGLRAGVPPRAGTVDLHKVVAGEDRRMGEMVADPGNMLLHLRKRPRARPRILRVLGRITISMFHAMWQLGSSDLWVLVVWPRSERSPWFAEPLLSPRMTARTGQFLLRWTQMMLWIHCGCLVRSLPSFLPFGPCRLRAGRPSSLLRSGTLDTTSISCECHGPGSVGWGTHQSRLASGRDGLSIAAPPWASAPVPAGHSA